MSSSNTPPPRHPRTKHQHSKSAAQAPPNSAGKPGQRRQKANRINNGNNHTIQFQNQNGDFSAAQTLSQPYLQDYALPDSSIQPMHPVNIPTGQRNPKHSSNSSRPSSNRLSPPPSSLTDSELAQPAKTAATPAKSNGAYAGPTFHASPAPSALPMPKFFSKSVPAVTSQPDLQSPPSDKESDSANSPSPSPPSASRAPIPVPARSEQSPLDFIFKADREEKARRNGSPASATFANSSNQSSFNGNVRHSKQLSHSSLNAVFPIELDGESKPAQPSPPTATPPAHRSVTAPSAIPQVPSTAGTNTESPAIQDLLNRLTQSQRRPEASTPPRTIERIPSEPSSRYHTPSPFNDGKPQFRSASGPTTPAPQPNESSDFFYGNRNLSPLFKAAKGDSAKRNSNLRTEITADSPIMPQNGFPSANGAPKIDPNSFSRNYLENVAGGRRSSVPHNQSQYMREIPNNRKMRTHAQRSRHPRPDSFPNNKGRPDNSKMASPPKSSISFVPSSVQGKSTPKNTKSPDALSLEQDLKRLLNLNAVSGGTSMTGVR